MRTGDADLLSRQTILDLEAQTSSFEPAAEERASWQRGADAAVNGFLDELSTLRTFTPACSGQSQKFANGAGKATDPADLIKVVVQSLSHTGLVAAGAGHMAFVPGGGLYIGAVADHVAAAVNAFSGDAFAAPVAVAIHEDVVRWLATMVGYDGDAWGDLTSGGSNATLTAFFVAREARQIRPRDYHKTCVYLSEHTHHCCEKALKVLFSDDLCVRRVPQRQHRMDAGALGAQIDADRAAGLSPWMVVATAGSTNLGLVDPLKEIAGIVKEHGLWMHVDGACGGFFKLCDTVRPLFDGLDEADSVVLDPHKGLFLPYGTGAVVFKKGSLLRHALAHIGAYLQDRDGEWGGQKSPMDYSLELTRPFRALRVWLALKVHSETLFAQALQEKLLLSAYCQSQVAMIATLRIVAERDLSIFAFRVHDPEAFRGDALTKQLFQAINRHDEVFLSSTVVDDRFVIRVAILSFRTHLATVDRLLEILREETRHLLAVESRP